MSKFKELYNADIARYGGKPETYIRVFHFLHRKASLASFLPMRFCTKYCSVYGQIEEDWK